MAFGCGLGGGVGPEADSDGLIVAALFGVHEVGQHLPVGGGGLADHRARRCQLSSLVIIFRKGPSGFTR